MPRAVMLNVDMINIQNKIGYLPVAPFFTLIAGTVHVSALVSALLHNAELHAIDVPTFAY